MSLTKSESISKLAKALLTFHDKVGKIEKDANNPFFKSKYASLSNILDAIRTPLSSAGLTFSQFPSGSHGLCSILIHAESGEYMQADYTMKPVKDDPQGIGSVITYQKRYALAAILGLNIDDDDDGEAASGRGKEAKKQEPKKEPIAPVTQEMIKQQNEAALATPEKIRLEIGETLNQAALVKLAGLYKTQIAADPSIRASFKLREAHFKANNGK
jgi:hypothetical protein